MADFDDDLWAFDVESVSKISPGPEEPDEEIAYAVTFNATGPNASAEVEVFADGVDDPAMIITLALSHLHVAFTAWARMTAGRHIANDDVEG